MGVESGMPADLDLLPILLKLKLKIQDAPRQATTIGRSEIWPVHQRVAELGGVCAWGWRTPSICRRGQGGFERAFD